MSDRIGWTSYSAAMEAGVPFIRLKLDTNSPIEMGEFVGAFTALASQYDRYIRTESPDADPEATLFVNDVREGCIEADLIPWLAGSAVAVGGAITIMASANTVHQFVERYGKLLKFYKKKGARDPDISLGQLGEVVDQVSAIASDPKAFLEIAAIEYENGEQRARVALKFTARDAREIRDNARDHLREKERTANATHPRVLMTFAQSRKKSSKLGTKRTGDRVIIEKIAPGRDLPLVYASPMAEAAIKQHIREAQENVYLKAFDVDVNVELVGDKPIAYRVTHLHEVIDLEDPSDS